MNSKEGARRYSIIVSMKSRYFLAGWFIIAAIFTGFKVDVGGYGVPLSLVGILCLGVVYVAVAEKVSFYSFAVALTVFFFCAVFLIAAGMFEGGGHLTKSFSSLFVFSILIFFSSVASYKAREGDWLVLEKVAILTVFVTIVSFCVEMVYPSLFSSNPQYLEEGKCSGIFSEPSHAAYSIVPFLAILIFSKTRAYRVFGLLSVLVFMWLSPSTTFFALICGVGVLYASSRRYGWVYILASMPILLFIIYWFWSGHFSGGVAARVAGVLDPYASFNLSSLVYVQGWQDAYFNLKHTFGLGLGFNMMGQGELPNVPVRHILAESGAGELNSHDGSFLFSKVVSEFGFFGILLFLGFALILVRRHRILRRRAPDDAGLVVQVVLAFVLYISMFVRTGGYFSSPFLLFLPVFFSLIRSRA